MSRAPAGTDGEPFWVPTEVPSGSVTEIAPVVKKVTSRLRFDVVRLCAVGVRVRVARSATAAARRKTARRGVAGLPVFSGPESGRPRVGTVLDAHSSTGVRRLAAHGARGARKSSESSHRRSIRSK